MDQAQLMAERLKLACRDLRRNGDWEPFVELISGEANRVAHVALSDTDRPREYWQGCYGALQSVLAALAMANEAAEAPDSESVDAETIHGFGLGGGPLP